MVTRKAKDAAINVAIIQTKPKIPPHLVVPPRNSASSPFAFVHVETAQFLSMNKLIEVLLGNFLSLPFLCVQSLTISGWY